MCSPFTSGGFQIGVVQPRQLAPVGQMLQKFVDQQLQNREMRNSIAWVLGFDIKANNQMCGSCRINSLALLYPQATKHRTRSMPSHDTYDFCNLSMLCIYMFCILVSKLPLCYSRRIAKISPHSRESKTSCPISCAVIFSRRTPLLFLVLAAS